ncbi:hypothetical protein [Sphingobacterium chungjuense]|uniref:hypothetical protein n=1 Tax=Sphingobacterium chungjuense TaxID=2675553 RepID=UPI0014077146|nr:hypothetical protein [Sphingobacterium chungjuense]
MKLNKRIGDTLGLVKIEYNPEYNKSDNADIVAEYLHALCSFYGELIGKNISLSNPIEFACKYYRIYLQGMLSEEGYAGDYSLGSIYMFFNSLITNELESSKIRQKDTKLLRWQEYSEALYAEFELRDAV